MDHPLRRGLLAELHGRPALRIPAPSRLLRVTLLDSKEAPVPNDPLAVWRNAGLEPPAPGARHHLVRSGPDQLIWERHGEFQTVGLLHVPRPGEAMAPAETLWPAGLPDGVGGLRIAATDVWIETTTTEEGLGDLAARFGHADVAAAFVNAGRSIVATDMRIGSEGYTMILVGDLGLPPERIGRLVRRLLEIDAYTMMTLLGLPTAREVIPAIATQERTLAAIIEDMSKADKIEDERALLERLGHVAREVERIGEMQSFRFAATHAYHDLVLKRLVELREERVEDWPRLSTFMDRRLGPAAQTCEAATVRHARLAERLERATAMLRTRVDIALEGQNQALLKSMDDRARTQLRLQSTVEGLSVAAISYYTLAILDKILQPLAHSWLHVDPHLAEAIAAPFVLTAVWFGMQRVRRRIHADEPGHSHD